MERRLGLAAALLLSLTTGVTPALADRGVGGDRDRERAASAERALAEEGLLHSSDGVRGTLAGPLPPSLRARTTTTATTSRQVAPGVTYSSWTWSRAVRGPSRSHLITVKWRQRGVRVEYADAGRVARTSPVASMLADDAVAAINGDFFDIDDTGAPLGVGKGRASGLRLGRLAGWNSAFYLDAGGVPQIGALALSARIVEHPDWQVTNLNSPHVEPGGIGIYTPAWGTTSGHRITNGARKGVRMVRVRDGRVVATAVRLPKGGPIKGAMLVGRGAGAQKLATLRKGDRLRLRWGLPGSPQVVVTGNRPLVDDGVVLAVDDRELHPRTAIGIDRDTRELLMLVVDGRSERSSGATMVELAQQLVDLGADEALNLDGGGSSTMVALKTNGYRGIVNKPSDGAPRSVANALQVLVSQRR